MCEMCLCCHVWYVCSLVLRPLPFLSSVCVHNNTWDRKIGGKLKPSFTPLYCYEHKWKVKMGEAWEQGYAWCMCVCMTMYMYVCISAANH